jgi:uncharacterized membrane protein (GlpM family)
MIQILVRFVVGGLVVSAFAIIGDLLKPKSFAGLFGAAPSVALATLSLTVAKEGLAYAAVEARSMVAGALAFFAYASLVSWIMMHRRFEAMRTTICTIPVWFLLALGIWSLWLK